MPAFAIDDFSRKRAVFIQFTQTIIQMIEKANAGNAFGFGFGFNVIVRGAHWLPPRHRFVFVISP